MLEVYTIYGGEMWKYAFDAVVGLIGNRTWVTLLRIVGIFAIVGVLASFIKTRNPMMFVQWLAIFMLITSVLLVPKRSVQIIDITDPAAVWKTDNVPVGLAGIASLTTSIGFKVGQLYDMMFARPDSVTYTKSGMLFGSQIVAETSDIRTQNPVLAQMLPDYVENCVIGDILLNHKYTVNELLNSTDPLGLITSDPSPLRGIYKTSSDAREFLTCAQAAAQIKTLVGTDTQPGSVTFGWLTSKIFGSKLNGATLLANAMGESYGYFYSGGLTAAQVMKNNVTNSAIRQGIRGFAARSSDTANLLNLATESSATKQRLSWAAGSVMATRTLPFAQSLLMLILVCLFPLVIALAAANHSLFGLNTLKLYVCGFLYFQMWPVMFAILNYAATFWLQSKTGGTALVLSNTDQVALQHSDVANLAGYLSLSIPLLSFYLTKGAASIGSQVAGSVFSSMAFGSAGVASTTADGNWSFNNMSMDNLNQNKMDTNMLQRQGQQTWQGNNGSTLTQTSSGQNVIDGSGAMSNLPVNMKLSQLASSGFQEQARQSQVNAQSALDGYNHSVTSGWSQLSQAASQTGSSDSLSKSSDNSQATNVTMGASKMMSAAESYAKANNISNQQAYNELMDISNQGSAAAGLKTSIGGGINLGVAKFGAEGSLSGEVRHTTGSSNGIQDNHSNSVDNRHDKNSQMVEDFRQGRDMVTSSRVTNSGNHTDNASTSNLQQFAATLNDAKSQYQQYTTSKTQSDEFSRMASLAQNQSASLDTNYTQEFVNWSTAKYGDRTQDILTSAPSARVAAAEFVQERLAPEIMGDYQQGRQDLRTGDAHQPFTLPANSPTIAQDNSGPVYTPVPGHQGAENPGRGSQTGQGNYPYTPGAAPYTVSSGQPGQSEGSSPVSPGGQRQQSDEHRYPSNPVAAEPAYVSESRTQVPAAGGGSSVSSGGQRQQSDEHRYPSNPVAAEPAYVSESRTQVPAAGGGSSVSSGGQRQQSDEHRYPSNPVAAEPAYVSESRTQVPAEGGGSSVSSGGQRQQSDEHRYPSNPVAAEPAYVSESRTQVPAGGGGAQRADASTSGEQSSVPGRVGPGVNVPDESRNGQSGGHRPFSPAPVSQQPLRTEGGNGSVTQPAGEQEGHYRATGSESMLPNGRREVSGSHPAERYPVNAGSSESGPLLPGDRHEVANSRTASGQQNTRSSSGNMPGSDGHYHSEVRPGASPLSNHGEVTRPVEPINAPGQPSGDTATRTSVQTTPVGRPSAGQQEPGADLHQTGQRTLNAQASQPERPDASTEATVHNRHDVQDGGHAQRQERGREVTRASDSPLQPRSAVPSVAGNRQTGQDMASDYRNNRETLPTPHNNTLPGHTALADKVAEERSANERNINNSSGEIGKKQSTVQASSDILKGEMENATNQQAIGRKEAEIDQKTPIIDSEETRKLKQQLAELRKKAG